MVQRVLAAVLAAALLASWGCASVSEQARQQIREAAVICDANLREWDQLTDAQRRRAHEAAARAFHVLNYSINDEPLSADYGSESEPQPEAAPADGAGSADAEGGNR